MMKRFLTLLGTTTAFAAAAFAQTNATSSDLTAGSTDYGIGRGARELTISGGGSSSKDLDDSLGGVNFSVGYFYTDTLEGLVRQSINYSNPNNAGSAWNGSTKLALDQHFGTGKVRPFVGLNLGYVYGEAVNDTFSGGVEWGVKYYVRPRTFIAATVEYGWFFEKAKSVEDRFDDGQFTWSLGVGFNF